MDKQHPFSSMLERLRRALAIGVYDASDEAPHSGGSAGRTPEGGLVFKKGEKE